MKIIAFVAALVFFVAGMYLFALAFQVPGFEALVFTGGILLIAAAIAIPVHLLKRIDA